MLLGPGLPEETAGSVADRKRKSKREQVRRWRKNNPERANAIARKSRHKNADKIRARSKAWYAANKPRALAAMADRRKLLPHIIKNEKLRSAFGISLEQYKALAASQNFCCAICGVPQAEQRRQMAVDHDHASGQIRALLCHNCNVGLGNFKDSQQILTKAIKYLHEHSLDKTTQQTDSRLSVSHSDNGSAL